MDLKKGIAIIAGIAFFSALGNVSAGTVIDTGVIASDAQSGVAMHSFRWFGNEDNLTPGSALDSENSMPPVPAVGDVVRLRVDLRSFTLTVPAGQRFSLQYARSTSGPWTAVGSSTPWTLYDNPGVADGQIIVTTLLSDSNVGGSYSESDPTADSPSAILPGQYGEWDWVLQNSDAATDKQWYFRMVYASSTLLQAYDTYPGFRAIVIPKREGGGGARLPPPATSAENASTTAHATGSLRAVVGKLPPTPCDSTIVRKVDLNGDCHVDMVDLSILIYYYGKKMEKDAPFDLTGDGKVDLFDVSVMMYYWTG